MLLIGSIWLHFVTALTSSASPLQPYFPASPILSCGNVTARKIEWKHLSRQHLPLPSMVETALDTGRLTVDKPFSNKLYTIWMDNAFNPYGSAYGFLGYQP